MVRDLELECICLPLIRFPAAFNKLSPGVTVSDVRFSAAASCGRSLTLFMQPDFPGDASNGIKLTLNSLIPSPSNLGIELGDVAFVASFAGSVSEPLPSLSLLPLRL